MVGFVALVCIRKDSGSGTDLPMNYDTCHSFARSANSKHTSMTRREGKGGMKSNDAVLHLTAKNPRRGNQRSTPLEDPLPSPGRHIRQAPQGNRSQDGLVLV
jgi:hypothetical protein